MGRFSQESEWMADNAEQFVDFHGQPVERNILVIVELGGEKKLDAHPSVHSPSNRSCAGRSDSRLKNVGINWGGCE